MLHRPLQRGHVLISRWIATAILLEDQVASRGRLLRRCIEILKSLRDLGNFDLIFAFVAG